MKITGHQVVNPGSQPGETPAFAAGIPLPSLSEFDYQSTQEPSVVPIAIETPSDPPASKASSKVPSRASRAGSVSTVNHGRQEPREFIEMV